MGVGFVEQQHGLLVPRRAENGGNVLRGLAHPHRFELGIADEQQAAAERVRDGFGADRLTSARRASKVEGKCEPGGMPLAEAPTVEDEIVLRHLRQGGVERAPGRGRQNHIVECPARHDRFDRAAAVRAEQTGEWDRRHASTLPGESKRNQAAVPAGFRRPWQAKKRSGAPAEFSPRGNDFRWRSGDNRKAPSSGRIAAER